MAGQKGNKNALRHGLTIGVLPKECAYISRKLNTFRAYLEQSLLERYGESRCYDAALIQTVIRLEARAMVAVWWIRNGNLTADQWLRFSNVITKSSIERDKCLKELGIDRRATDHSQAGAIVFVPPVDTPQDAITVRQEGATDEPAA